MEITPSPQEQVLKSMLAGEYELAMQSVKSGLADGKSPGLLSVVRPDLAIGFAEAWQRDADMLSSHEPDSYKTQLFNALHEEAIAGDAEAVGALFKVASSAGQVAVATELFLGMKDSVAELRSNRKYVQFIGSFNPQHIGHRSTIQSTLAAAGSAAEVVLQVVDSHPIKKDLPPYEPRYKSGEERLLSSSLIDNKRVTILDVPAGNGLARDGTAQIELIADTVGDNELRWLVGSDKFITDVGSAKKGKHHSRAVVRFKHPRMHLYVARRVDHNLDELQDAIDYVQEEFGLRITQVPEAPSLNVLRSAASKIRTLRQEGRHDEANEMEMGDLA